MPRLFCDSVSHFTQYCDIRISNEARRKILNSKKLCFLCLMHRKGQHSYCNFKCFICFSKEHNTVFCSERFNVVPLSVPKIDNDLLQRFFKMFYPLEQYQMAFSFSSASQLYFLNKLIVIDTVIIDPDIYFKDYDKQLQLAILYIIYGSFDIVLIKNEIQLINFTEHKTQYSVFFNKIVSNKILMNAKVIKLQTSTITPSELFSLLSAKMKVLHCYEVKLTSDINFAEILEKLPHIEELLIEKTNIVITNTWPEDLLKMRSQQRFLKIRITIPDLDFDVKKVFAFVKSKCIKYVTVTLEYGIFDERNKDKMRKNIISDVRKYFIPIQPAKDIFDERPIIAINAFSKNNSFSKFNLETFTTYCKQQ